MSDTILTAVLLLGAGFLSGILNAVAGGGSLVSLPLLIFVGLPATVANATNRIALFIGGIGATHSFAKRGLIPLGWFRLALPPALVGVVFGTWGATRIGDVAFERILAVVLLLAAILIVWQPLRADGSEEIPEPPGGAKRWWLRAAFLGLGMYSGFIQAGVGFLFVALFASQGIDLIRANGVKAPLILVFTGLAMVLFAFAGLLDWGAGLTMAGGQFFGAKTGVRLQVSEGSAVGADGADPGDRRLLDPAPAGRRGPVGTRHEPDPLRSSRYWRSAVNGKPSEVGHEHLALRSCRRRPDPRRRARTAMPCTSTMSWNADRVALDRPALDGGAFGA